MPISGSDMSSWANFCSDFQSIISTWRPGVSPAATEVPRALKKRRCVVAARKRSSPDILNRCGVCSGPGTNSNLVRFVIYFFFSWLMKAEVINGNHLDFQGLQAYDQLLCASHIPVLIGKWLSEEVKNASRNIFELFFLPFNKSVMKIRKWNELAEHGIILSIPFLFLSRCIPFILIVQISFWTEGETSARCYHIRCLDPPVTKSPKVRGCSWHCEACDSGSENSVISPSPFLYDLYEKYF